MIIDDEELTTVFKSSLGVKKMIPLIIFLVCFVPLTSHSWFFIQEESPEFQTVTTATGRESVSSGYFLPYTGEVGMESPSLLRDDKGQFHISADRISIDIPLNILSYQVFDTSSFLDRQIAANLRIRNIIEEYLAAKNRTRYVLKDLGIPYLDSDKKQKISIQGREDDIQTGKRLRKEIENISLYSIGVVSINRDQTKIADDPVAQMEKRLSRNRNDWIDPEKTDVTELNETGQLRIASGQHGGKSVSSELPWIIRIILNAVRYLFSNKLEILLWSSVSVILWVLVVVLVKK